MLIRPTVAHVTADEPFTAAMIAHPTTFTCSRRPGSHPSQGARPVNRYSDSLDLNKISPIQINRGSAVRAQFQLASQTVLASNEPTVVVLVNRLRAIRPTASSDTAIQMPLAMSNTSAPKRMIDA